VRSRHHPEECHDGCQCNARIGNLYDHLSVEAHAKRRGLVPDSERNFSHLIIMVAEAEPDIYAAWRRRTLTIGSLMGVFALGCIAFSFFLAAQLRRAGCNCLREWTA
jgi:hypothetical protein